MDIAIEPGEMRHVITIQTHVDGVDAEGGPTKAWSDAATARGKMIHLSGHQLEVALARDARVTARVKMHYYAGLAPATHRLKLGERVLNILYVDNVDELNRVLLVDVMEAV